MAIITNEQIAGQLSEIGDLLDFQGANPFRIRAYRSAARAIENLNQSVTELIQGTTDDDDANPVTVLTQINGIGKDLAGKLVELVETGRIAMLDDLLAEIPESALDMLRIPGLGPKKAGALYRELNITDLAQLKTACERGEVRKLKGFAEKTEQTILQGIEQAAQIDTRLLWIEADEIATRLVDELKNNCRQVMQIEAAGSYRRCRETVGDLDLLVDSEEPDKVMDALLAVTDAEQVLARGKTKMSIRMPHSRFQVDLRVVPTESFGAALQYFTGSQAHNVELRSRAKKRGLKINEYGVFRDEQQIAGADEAEVYQLLDLPLIPPELREARQEFDWADRNAMPKLVEQEQIRADLHMHSTWTDGTASIEQMARAAKKLGYEYIAMTDHSKRVTVVGGLDADALRREWDEIDKVNTRITGITVLKGVECDILEKGGMDLDDGILAQADWVLASIHFGQSQSIDQLTRRAVEALRHPHVNALAHPTGRMLGQRPAYPIDMDAVMETARDEGKLLELNASPYRLDLNDTHCTMARRLGIPIVISTDSHQIDSLSNMRLGINQARRGGLEAKHVANTLPLKQFLKLIGKS